MNMNDATIPEGFEVVNVPIHEVAYLEDTVKTKAFDDGRLIEFYEAAPDQFVKAYVGGKAVWTPVAGFSRHRNIEVVIVNLSNGCQIITDHDPRAVFGVAPPSLELERFYPDDACVKGVLVPCEIPADMDTWAGKDPLRLTYTNLWDAIDAKAELLSSARLGSRVGWDSEESLWVLYSQDLAISQLTPPGFESSNLQWAAVSNLHYTHKLETGYDLTVPGYETFMSADGVVLSNTMSVHVPSGDAAIKDVREKMMASKMLWSIKDRNKVMGSAKHEQVLGLNMGQLPGGANARFANEDEAMDAIERGEIDLNANIEIGE